MKTESTPGPWRIAGETPLDYRIQADADGVFVGHISKLGAEGIANARLIAAAPDLLAALEGLFEHCAMTHKHWGEGCNQREADAAQTAARAAIAKATQP